MREVQPGDFVIHLTDNRHIAGVSEVAKHVSTDFRGLEGTAWADMDGYLVWLRRYSPCNPPLDRTAFLGSAQLAPDLRRIRADNKNLFYDRDLNLNQGFYLTPAPDELVRLLNYACAAETGHILPLLDQFADWSPKGATRSGFGERPAEAPSHQRIWLYAPGRDAERWEEFYRDSVVAIGWDELGDLSNLQDLEEVTSRIREVFERDDNPVNDARACYEFVHEMRPGDLVFAKRGLSRIIGYGTVVGEYKFDDARESYRHVRAMRWDRRGDWSSPQTLPAKTLTEITADLPLVEALRRLADLESDDDDAEVAPPQERVAFTIEDALEGLFLRRDDFERALQIWKAKRNLIIQGPPGVGKTYIAKRLAYALMGYKDPSRVGMIQFHQSYSYEDFVQGYRPTRDGLSLRNGLFLEFCRQAARDRDETYVFIIDEINRGNLSRIFGELMMLIEADKRGSAWSLPLTYSDSSEAQFFVPDNIYILGLMNTADRSLAMVDYALRRRFAFWMLHPQFEAPAFKQSLINRGLTKATADFLINRIEKLNKEIISDSASLGAGYQIGHSYFCQEIPEGTSPTVWLRGVIATEIIPLLSEYWVDDPDRVKRWTDELTSGLKLE
jgi:5-methylcytosine-specific restriction protein B